mmetsp:Transcript_27412/g.49353  ORF Transcript_27412/g.49353 Transcript_27412/m.49353 type:complete len:835 (+) Transcript_27412:2804-5308(+)
MQSSQPNIQAFCSESFNPHAEAVRVLMGGEASYQDLHQLYGMAEGELSSCLHDNQEDVSSLLNKLGTGEDLLVETIDYIEQMRGSISKCVTALSVKKKDMRSFWYKSRFHKQVLKELEGLEVLLTGVDSLQDLSHTKHFERATLQVKELKNKLESSQYAESLKGLKQELQEQSLALSTNVQAELRTFLYFKDKGADKLFTRYSELGLLNLTYFQSKAGKDDLVPLLKCLHGVASLQRVVADLSSEARDDMRRVFMLCIAKSTPVVHEASRLTGLCSYQPSNESREILLKFINGLVATGTQIIMRHLQLRTQMLQTFFVSYQLENLWQAFQTEIVEVLACILGSSKNSLHFLAESEETNYATVISGLFPNTPYYLPYVLLTVQEYYDQLSALLTSHCSLTPLVLPDSLQAFTKDFLTVLLKDAREHYISTIGTSESFRYKKSPEPEFNIMTSLKRDLLFLSDIKQLLPVESQGQLLAVLTTVLALLFSELQSRVSKFAGDSNYYLHLLHDRGYQMFLKQSPNFQAVFGSPPMKDNRDDLREATFVNFETEVAQGLDVTNLTFLAAVFYNIQVLLTDIRVLESDYADVEIEQPSTETFVPQREVKAQTKMQKFKRLLKEKLSKKKRPVEQVQSPETSIRVNDLQMSLENLRDMCLMLIRGEIRFMCIRHFKLVKGVDLWRDSGDVGGESLFSNLTRDLISTQMGLKSVMSKKLLHYVFEGIAELLAELVINSLAFIRSRRANKEGLRIFNKNLRSLQADLDQLDLPGEVGTVFERVQEYMRLLSQNETTLIAVAKQQPDLFTPRQWKTQLLLTTYMRPQPASEAVSRTLEELTSRR